ncbi:MAG: response regulator transcription factor [Chloroherpetonaceae bacterium]|nr:response regulator transcription factor [Chloroherpetonaceae bacterium]
MNARILIVEDDERLASVLEKGLSEAGFLTSRAPDAESAFERFAAEAFDLVLTDIMLPKMNGIELCKKLKAQKPSLPVIMLTALGETDDKLQGFDAGADDYLAKPFDFRELLARINARLKARPTQAETNETLAYADLAMNLRTKVVKRQGKEIPLTAKEFALLEFFLRNPERVLSREEISKTVWNTHFDTGTNFIDVYINYLRKKIDKPFPTKLIHTKTGMGFYLKAE